MEQAESGEVVLDVACPLCGCVCDDLQITVDRERIVAAQGACHLAEPWYLAQNTHSPPAAQVDGRPASEEEALARAAQILSAARAPLIYGLSRSSTAGQRVAVRLADRLGAVIDTTASRCHAPSIMALQVNGESTCTLGEARNRCDLVLFWGCNPPQSHPRHFERYSLEPPGMFLPGGRADRHLVVIDTRRTEAAEAADTFLQVEPDADFEVIWALRGLIRGQQPAAGRRLGAPPEQLADLAGRLTSCRSGVVYFGLGLTSGGLGHSKVEALLRLVTDLNDHTRFYARRMRLPGDVAGADSVLCWQTGFPFSVNLNRGYPRYNPGEYSANEVLQRREADACLLLGSEGVAELSPQAIQTLRSIPTIVLDYPNQQPPLKASVHFTTAVYGVHRPGTAYRMDETPIPLRQVLPTDYPSDDEILRQLLSRTAPHAAVV